jgi:DNA-binding GntR family transcriptional regulator
MNVTTNRGIDQTSTIVAKVTIPEQIAAALRNEIVTGRLAAGTRLRQVEIAQRFGVSTTPVREAFGLLQSDGLVRIDTHRGVTVFLPTVEDLIEHYEIRRTLEMLAVEKAAERFQASDTPPLAAILDEMRGTSDPVHYVERNQAFHMGLYRVSGRARLVAMIEDLRNASLAYNHLYAAADVPHDAERLDAEHREILAACQAGDPARAASAVRDHISQTILHVMQALETRDNTAPTEQNA